MNNNHSSDKLKKYVKMSESSLLENGVIIFNDFYNFIEKKL